MILEVLTFAQSICESVSLSVCPTLCDLTDYSLPGSLVHRNFQARILEWVATPFSRRLPDPGLLHFRQIIYA